MIRRQPRSTRTDPLFPYTRSSDLQQAAAFCADDQHVMQELALRRQQGGIDGMIGAGRAHVVRHQRIQEILGLRAGDAQQGAAGGRSEEQTSELQSLMRTSYAVFCVKQKNSELHY